MKRRIHRFLIIAAVLAASAGSAFAEGNGITASFAEEPSIEITGNTAEPSGIEAEAIKGITAEFSQGAETAEDREMAQIQDPDDVEAFLILFELFLQDKMQGGLFVLNMNGDIVFNGRTPSTPADMFDGRWPSGDGIETGFLVCPSLYAYTLMARIGSQRGMESLKGYAEKGEQVLIYIIGRAEKGVELVSETRYYLNGMVREYIESRGLNASDVSSYYLKEYGGDESQMMDAIESGEISLKELTDATATGLYPKKELSMDLQKDILPYAKPVAIAVISLAVLIILFGVLRAIIAKRGGGHQE